MLYLVSYTSRLALLAVVFPLLGVAAAIKINSVCQAGTCGSPDSISFGGSSTGTYNFDFTLGDGDIYNITGSFLNTYGAAGTLLGFFPSVTYTGIGPSVAADVISLDMLQNIFDNSPGTFDGTYTEFIPFSLAAGTSATGEVFFDGQGVGLVGPILGPGFSLTTKSANLSGLTGDTLVTDYNLTFTFPGGTVPGTSVGSSAIPEPAQTMLLGIGLASLLLVKSTRLRSARTIRKANRSKNGVQ